MKVEQLLPNYIRESVLLRVLTIAALTIVVGVGFITVASSETGETIREHRQTELQTLAETEAEAVDNWVIAHEQRANAVARSDPLQSDNVAVVQRALARAKTRLPSAVAAVHYVDADTGTIRASTAPAAVDSAFESRGFEPGSTIGSLDAVLDRETGVYAGHHGRSLAFTSRVPDTRAVVVVVVDASDAGPRIRNTISGGQTTVLASDGTPLFGAPNFSETVATANATGSDAAGPSGRVAHRDDQLVATASVTGSGLTVVKTAPRQQAYALAGTVRTHLVVLAFVALAGFCVTAFLFQRKVISKLSRVTDEARALASGDLDTEIQNVDQIGEVGKLKDAFIDTREYLVTVAEQADAIAEGDFDDEVFENDVPGSLGEALEAMRHDLQAYVTEVEQARDEARESRQQAERLAETLERQAEDFGEAMQAAADGDLTRRVNTDVQNDAMQEIAEGFNDMVSELEATVVEIRSFAADLDGSSEQVTASVEEVRRASQEVSESVQTIATGAETQRDQIQETTTDLADFQTSVDQIATRATEIAEMSSDATETGQRGRTLATEASEVMRTVETKTQETVSEVEHLDHEMERIGDVVQLIEDIAEQTNVLALNASVEAARAGRDGDGFAVVADEIKTLARDTGQATDDVAELIEAVQEATATAVEDMQATNELVQDGMTAVDEAIGELETVVGQIEDVNERIQSISDVTDDQAASIEEVVAMASEIDAISDRNASQAENAAAAAEEQTASLTEVSDSIDSLSGRVSELHELLDSFETGDEPASGREPTRRSAAETATDGGGQN